MQLAYKWYYLGKKLPEKYGAVKPNGTGRSSVSSSIGMLESPHMTVPYANLNPDN